MPTHSHNPPATLADHHLEWNDRLQDWLDGDLDTADQPLFEAHLADCTICQQRLGDFEALDNALQADAPHLSLDSAFDARVFAQIDAIDETQRAVARQRIERELQDNLQALSRSWRRTLAFVIPGIIGGIALALTLTGFFDASGLTDRLAVEGASELGGNASLIHVAITALLGASIGGATAAWMAKAAG